jgi:MFS family permease
LNEAGVTFGILASFVTSAVFGENWRILFLFMLPVSFIAMVALFFKFKNHDTQSKQSETDINLQESPRPRKISKATYPTPFPKYEFTMCIFLVIATQASGQPTFLYYAKSAFPDNSTIITFGIVKFLSTLFCSGLVDKLGRKTMLTTGCLVMTASLFCIGFFSDRFWSSFLMQFSFGAYAFGFSISFGACLFIVLNELFDDFWRQRLIGYSMTLLYLLNFVISNSFLDIIELIGISGIFFINSGCCLVAAVVFQRFLPETKGKQMNQSRKSSIEKNNCENSTSRV